MSTYNFFAKNVNTTSNNIFETKLTDEIKGNLFKVPAPNFNTTAFDEIDEFFEEAKHAEEAKYKSADQSISVDSELSDND